jgi:hypothetical protein
VNVHGFWSDANAKNKKDRSVYTAIPRVPPGRPDPYQFPSGEWRDHWDRDAVARAEAAIPTKQVHRDS